MCSVINCSVQARYLFNLRPVPVFAGAVFTNHLAPVQILQCPIFNCSGVFKLLFNSSAELIFASGFSLVVAIGGGAETFRLQFLTLASMPRPSQPPRVSGQLAYRSVFEPKVATRASLLLSCCFSSPSRGDLSSACRHFQSRFITRGAHPPVLRFC